MEQTEDKVCCSWYSKYYHKVFVSLDFVRSKCGLIATDKSPGFEVVDLEKAASEPYSLRPCSRCYGNNSNGQ